MSNTGLIALVPTLLLSEFFSYFNPPSAFVSSRLSSPFIFTLQSFSTFAVDYKMHNLSVGQRSAQSFPFHSLRKGIHIYVSSCNHFTGSRRKTIYLSLDGETPKINFDSAFVCLVDWQRCTQAVIRVYETMREEKRKRESKKNEF